MYWEILEGYYDVGRNVMYSVIGILYESLE